MTAPAPTEPPRSRGVLSRVERLGNRLPDPATLFIVGAVLVMVISQIGAWRGWSVEKPKIVHAIVDGKDIARVEGTETVTAQGLLSADGLYWCLSSMVRNFINFPPLGIVLVGLMGIGLAERSGCVGALLKAVAARTPGSLLTPMMVFLGVNASLATDAGYVVLPPIAAVLYKATGRSPLVGIGAVFAGIGGGFSANLCITSLDPLLAGLTQAGAQIIDPACTVKPTCNWYFMIAATFLLTGAGWWVTARIIEPRFRGLAPEHGGPAAPMAGDHSHLLKPQERRGLAAAGVVFALTIGLVVAMVTVPGWPLYLRSDPSARWIASIVPLLFFVFLTPGVAYGVVAGTIKSDKDAARMMGSTMSEMGPYIVLAFFAAQFIEYFRYSNLGVMVAMKGGQALASAELPPWALLVAFVCMVMMLNLLIASASAKYAFIAPVFVPMLMQVGISPALTQAAYRVGDSVTNTITPLNSYLIVILVVMQKYVPKAGMGTLVALMLPYAVVFWVVWTAMLVLWVQMGIPLGPGGGLWYGVGK